VDQQSLVWVVVDGVPRHISAFAHLPPRRRPSARCPQCGRVLTLKLGRVRRHHAAHEPGEVCASTHPETALHINCKLALATALRDAAGSRSTLTILRRCAGAPAVKECARTLTAEWLRDWDEVMVEHRVGVTRRPDIVIKRRGVAIGAIEVLVSHAVSPEKASALAQLAVPWVEVLAAEHLASAGEWAPRQPLHAAYASDVHEWRCDAHQAMHAAALDAAAARQSAEREGARHATVLLAARVVDVYHAGGTRERLIYRVTQLLTDGRAHTMRLQRGGVEIATMPLPAATDPRAAWPALRAAYVADVERFARGHGSFADSPMRWARGDAAENIVDEALADRVGLDPTPLATRYPRRWFYARQQRRWFLPPEMRDARWDRPREDPFAAHPAWSKAQSSVRERPAPEGSWSTPVFASRPVAAMFRGNVRSITPASDDPAVLVVELTRTPAQTRRAIVVVERATTPEAIASLASSLAADGVDAVWISHPLDWSDALAALPWAPAGRDWRGKVVIAVDELGVFRADQFARALATDDRRLSADAIRGHMAGRVQRMRGRVPG